MRKLTTLIVIMLTVLFLVSCETNTPENTPTPDESTPTEEIIGELPVFNGLDDMIYYIGDSFDPMEGISADDYEDGDISDQINIVGIEELPLTDNIFDEVGVFELTYIIIDSDLNWVNETITLTVLEVVEISDCDYDRDGYTLTWCDNFSGEGENLNAQGVNLDHWGFQLGTGSEYGLTNWGNNEQQYYRSENANVINGELIIEAKKETFGGMPYTSSRLFTKNLFSQQYGRFEAMIELPAGEGLWPAFWLMPQDDAYGGWANSGEIDIMEARGRLPGEMSSALHYGGQWPNNTHTSRKYVFQGGQSIEDKHLYAVEWDETEIRFYVNDVLYHTVTNWYNTGYDYPAPFDQPFYIILNLAVGGGFDGNRIPPDSLFDEPVEMIVSFVRVYQRNDN